MEIGKITKTVVETHFKVGTAFLKLFVDHVVAPSLAHDKQSFNSDFLDATTVVETNKNIFLDVFF